MACKNDKQIEQFIDRVANRFIYFYGINKKKKQKKKNNFIWNLNHYLNDISQ